MPRTYYVHPSTVYYLDPSAPDGLRVEVEPGRCNIYHEHVAAGAHNRAWIHMQNCEDCQAWLARCEAIVMRSPVELENQGVVND